MNCVVWARQAFEWSVKYSQFESRLSASPVRDGKAGGAGYAEGGLGCAKSFGVVLTLIFTKDLLYK